MGSIISIILHDIYVLFRTNWSKNKYRLENDSDLAEKPFTQKACRSRIENNLIPYQSKIDRQKSNQIVLRTFVPDDKVSWDVEWIDYRPIEYTAEKLLINKPDYADIADPLQIKNWNKLDPIGNIDRRSHMGEYKIVNGRPINPVGRTGISGRGQLGKWGVNHAADPIVTRWKLDRNNQKVKHPETKKFMLQFVSIKRLDTDEWAIPGGMCDPGEKVSQTLKREFMEEATDCLASNKHSRKQIEEYLKDFFENGFKIYKGYVDDPRNTDNAWMETIAFNFHDNEDSVFKSFQLVAGDDAGSVQWMDIDKSLNLYASHKYFIELTVKHHSAHW